MSILVERNKRNYRRAFQPTTALAKAVHFDEEMLYVTLMDGRLIGVPIIWFPILHEAPAAERERCKIGGGGISLHWPDIDENISVAGLLAGADVQST